LAKEALTAKLDELENRKADMESSVQNDLLQTEENSDYGRYT